MTAFAPWVEKYRPASLKDVVAHGDIVSSIKKMMFSGELTHLLLYGPPGTGKTSTILALARESKGCELLELNASDDRGIDTVRLRIKEFVSTRKLTNYFKPAASSSLKLVILDECDSMTLPAQMALRRIIEQFSLGARFCLIANHINKLIPALLSRCTRFRFAPLPERDITERIQHVATQEKVLVEKDAVKAIVATAGGDLRKAINSLQAAHLSQNTSSESKENPAISADLVYRTMGLCKPQDMARLYEMLRSSNYRTSYDAVKKMVMEDGHSVVDLATGLHNLIMGSAAAWSSENFANIIQDLADIERRLSLGASEQIQLAALVAAFQLYGPKKTS